MGKEEYTALGPDHNRFVRHGFPLGRHLVFISVRDQIWNDVTDTCDDGSVSGSRATGQ